MRLNFSLGIFVVLLVMVTVCGAVKAHQSDTLTLCILSLHFSV